MNLKYIGLLILLFLLSTILFFQKINSNKLNIRDLGVVNYIPKDNKISLISNANSFEINKFLKNNLKKNKIEDFNLLKKGIYSFLGFNLESKFKDIYNGELSFSIFDNNEFKSELLLIIKVKKNSNINSFLNINDTLNEQNKIIEFQRPEKINYLKYAFRTKDNYIIFSSSEDLMKSSINFKKKNLHENIFQNLPEELLTKTINNKLIFISNNNLINTILNDKYLSDEGYFIIFPKYKNDVLNIKSYSFNNSKSLDQELFNNDLLNYYEFKSFISTKYFDKTEIEFPFYKIDNLENKILQEINNKINNKILFSKDNKDWLLVLKVNKEDEIIFNDLNILEDFNKSYIESDNINYYVYSKDKIDLKDNKIIYEKENPIFIKEFNNLIFISNKFSYLSNNQIFDNRIIEYFGNRNKKLLIDEQIYLKDYSQKIFKFSDPILNKIYLFTSNLLNIKVKQLLVKTEQELPELNPSIFIETDLEVS